MQMLSNQWKSLYIPPDSVFTYIFVEMLRDARKQSLAYVRTIARF